MSFPTAITTGFIFRNMQLMKSGRLWLLFLNTEETFDCLATRSTSLAQKVWKA